MIPPYLHFNRGLLAVLGLASTVEHHLGFPNTTSEKMVLDFWVDQGMGKAYWE